MFAANSSRGRNGDISSSGTDTIALVRQRLPNVVGNPHFPQNSRIVLIM